MQRACAFIFILLSSVLSHDVLALDCVRPIARVFSGHDGNKIYVIYTDGFANAGMTLSDVDNDEQAVNRTLAVILSGYLAERTITFRYVAGQDGSAASCTPSVTQRLVGAWVN